MKIKSTTLFFLLIFLFSGITSAFAQTADKMMIVIIDGARYTETLGDQSKTYTPKMWELTTQGTMIDNFANNNYTYTSRAIPALWCGAWTPVQDINYQNSSTQYAVLPSIFEYYRKQKNMPAEECFYVLKYISSLWLPSFDADYGPDYWPTFHSVGVGDKDVARETQLVMDNAHPHFLLVYLADVDHAGHSGNWDEYTSAIHTADSIVGVLWEKIQSDPFYKDQTNLIVTNDHGRHDDQHGGFQGHGCSCEGCRHIQFLAIGPSFKENYVSSQYRVIPDMAVTASYLLGVNPDKASGSVMNEIFKTSTGLDELTTPGSLKNTYPNPFTSTTRIRYHLKTANQVLLQIFSLDGKEIQTLVNAWETPGEKEVDWNGTNTNGQKVKSGIYLYQLQVGNKKESGKLILN